MNYILSLITASVLATSLSAEIVGGVAILVKDEPITLYDIKKTMRETGFDKAKAAELLIRKKLEEQELKKRNISVSNDEIYQQIEMMAKQNGMSVSELYEAMLRVRKLSQKELKEKIKEAKLKEKLYSAIAFSTMEQPSEEELLEYYNLHKELYTTHETYNVILYSSQNQNALMQKIANPMLYLQDVTSSSETIEAKNIDPRLLQLLEATAENSFTKIIPAPSGGFMSFYITKKSNKQLQSFQLVRDEIRNSIMQERRAQVLNDYFERLRLNTQIKNLRSVN